MEKNLDLQPIEQQEESLLYNDVCEIIEGARKRVASFVNTEVCLTNWHVGKRIKEDVLYNRRAEYGKKILRNLSVKLIERYGKAGDTRSLNIVYAVRTFFRKRKLGTQRVPNWLGLICVS